MIAADQPTIFGSEVIAAVSSVQDGNLKFDVHETDTQVIENRRKFLEKAGLDIAHTTLVSLTYKTDNFAKYRMVEDDDKRDGMTKNSENYADALFTIHADHALFLPIADCVGVILHDSKQKLLMVSHVGRHSAEIEGALKSVQFMEAHGGRAANINVWLSPAVGKATYPLHAYEGKSLHEVITQQLQKAGVRNENIEVSNVDTASDENYYSHSQFLKGAEAKPGRFAIVAMMSAQGEPAA